MVTFQKGWGYSALSWCSDVTTTTNKTSRKILGQLPYCEQNPPRILTIQHGHGDWAVERIFTYCNVLIYRRVKLKNFFQCTKNGQFNKPVWVKCPIQFYFWKFRQGQWLSLYKGILLWVQCPSRLLPVLFSSQIRLTRTRQPLVATNLIIYKITRLNSWINTIKYQLFLSFIHLVTHQRSDLWKLFKAAYRHFFV